MSTPSKRAAWVRSLVDYGAAGAFLVAFLITRDVMTATKALMAASVLAVVVGFIVERRVAWIPLATGAMAMIFGGLTLFFHDDRFIKMKPTVMYLGFGALLLGGLALRKNPLKSMLSDSLKMPDAAWRTLTIRYGLFFLALAALNEAVWRTQTTEIWAWFKFPGLMIVIFAFALSQTPFMMRYVKAEDLPPPPPSE